MTDGVVVVVVVGVVGVVGVFASVVVVVVVVGAELLGDWGAFDGVPTEWMFVLLPPVNCSLDIQDMSACACVCSEEQIEQTITLLDSQKEQRKTTDRLQCGKIFAYICLNFRIYMCSYVVIRFEYVQLLKRNRKAKANAK